MSNGITSSNKAVAFYFVSCVYGFQASALLKREEREREREKERERKLSQLYKTSTSRRQSTGNWASLILGMEAYRPLTCRVHLVSVFCGG